MDEQEHSVGPQRTEPAAPGVTSPITVPAAGSQEPHRHGEAVRKAITSRGAGWVVATALTGAVVALSVNLATGPSVTVVQPASSAGPARLVPGLRVKLPLRQVVPGAPRARVPVRLVAPPRLRIWVSPGQLVPAGPQVQVQVPVLRQVRVPARLRVQVPMRARVRVRLPAG